MLLSQDAVPQSSRPNLLQQLENLRWASLHHLPRGLLQKKLLESDQHWDGTLTEASLSRLPGHLHHHFAMMLQMCEVSNPLGLYKKHMESLSENLFYNYKRCHPEINDYHEAIFNEALVYLEDQVLKLGGTDLAHFGLPQPDKSAVTGVPLPLARETTYDVFEQANYAAENEPSLNE